MDRDALELIGTIGDVNPLDYGGGFVYRDKVGATSLEYYEPDDEDDADSRLTCYRVDLDYGDESWMDLTSIAASCGIDGGAEALRRDLNADDPIVRAMAFWSVALHHGWAELDHDPLRLSRKEAETRIKS